jgi:putative transposase
MRRGRLPSPTYLPHPLRPRATVGPQTPAPETPNVPKFGFWEDGAAYFITPAVVEWLPVFVNREPVEILAGSLRYLHRRKHLRVAAYVFMPTHAHLLVYDENLRGERLREAVHYFRRYTGRLLCDYVDRALPPRFGRIIRRHAEDDRRRRFWQPGLRTKAVQSAEWVLQKIEYIHNNPVRAGLVADPSGWGTPPRRSTEAVTRGWFP